MNLNTAQVLRALKDRWWLLLAAALVAGAAAYTYTKLPWVEPRWRSSVWIQAAGRLDYGNSLAIRGELQPLAEDVLQLSIMRQVDQTLQLDMPPEQLLAETKAVPVVDSSEVQIDVEDRDPGRAESVALAIAQIYTRTNNASQQGLPREQQLLFDTLDRPSAATLSWPQTRVLAPAAALLGLLAAAIVVVIEVYLDNTVQTVDDVLVGLGAPILGTIPGKLNGRGPRTLLSGQRASIPPNDEPDSWALAASAASAPTAASPSRTTHGA